MSTRSRVDPTTAALVGAALGTGGTLITAMLNPFSTARHARAAKNLEMRRDAYAAGLRALRGLTELRSQENLKAVLGTMIMALPEMRLVGSPDVAELYSDVYGAVDRIREAHDEALDRLPDEALFKEFQRALKAFTEAARADLGVDDV